MARKYAFYTDVQNVLDDDSVSTPKIVNNAVTPAKADLTTPWIYGTGNLQVTGAPANDNDAANKAYVDAVAQGLDLKASCRAATDAALPAYTFAANVLTATANGAIPAQDGVALVLNDSLLVKDETAGNAKYNGIYTVTQVGDGANPWKLTRRSDADTSAKLTPGAFTFIEEGTVSSDTGWVMVSNAPFVLNTDACDWTQFSGAGAIVAGDGLYKVGNTLNVGAGNGILANPDDIEVRTGPGLTFSAGKVVPDWGVTPVDVAAANSAGVGTTVARIDHVHAHGAHTDPQDHAIATEADNGFLAAADQKKLNRVVLGSVQTVDATPTTAATVLIAVNKARTISACVVGRKSDGTEYAAYQIVGLFGRSGGAPFQKGSTQVVVQIEDTAAWNADFAISGNDIVVQVTGVAATTIDWEVFIESPIAP